MWLDQEIKMTAGNRSWLHYASWVVAFVAGAFGAYAAVQQARHNAERDRQLAIAEAKVEREKAETIAARESAISALHESSDHGYAELDEHGRVTEWNPALARWTGYTEDEMRGHDILALMPPDKRAGHERGYAEIIADPKSKGKTFVVQCELQPRDPAKKPMQVRVNARVVQPPGEGKRYAVALIDRERKIVELAEKETESAK